MENDSQTSLKSTEESVANWAYMNVKAELNEYQSDENNSMEKV